MNRYEPYRDLVKEISEHLRLRARFSLPSDLQAVADRFVNHHIAEASILVPKGHRVYRARINPENMYAPLPKEELGAPPVEKARSGRISPAGIPCFYSSLDIETAIHEVRPWIGAYVSVGEFEARADIKAVNLYGGENTLKYSGSTDEHAEKRYAAFQGNQIKKEYFLTPRSDTDELAYLASQYLAEMFKARGVGAVIYGSVMLEEGVNLAIFSQSDLDFIQSTCHKVYKVGYSFSPVEQLSGHNHSLQARRP